MSASFLRSADGLVGIEYGHFLVESRGLTEPPRPAFEDGKVLSPVDDAFAVGVVSSFTRHALVQIESWDGEPEGEVTEECVVHFSDASIAARAVMAPGPESGTLELPAPGTYRVRVHRWGGDQVDHLMRTYPDAPIHRVEHVVLRLWPTDEPAQPREAPLTELGEQHRALGSWLTSR
ncbi:hypothetical protein [Lentzea sp. NPDC051838]|uniref:hypothetical protein n=1 Tax=Lentzea sp. NPDC051838 TaxID=3154849 RepID=UPI003447AA64